MSRRLARGPITVGLVNNMPDAALRTTERQFRELLALAAPHAELRLRVFALPGGRRSASAQSYLSERCEPVDALWSGETVDGLIITGTEPGHAAIEDEPSWPILTRLFTWAERHAASTILSCHAAHAAVQFLDGIRRHPLPRKRSGIFLCEKAADHLLVAGLPASWRTPHSRANDLPEAALARAGYVILSRSADAGVDMFAKERDGLMLFIQGHPEYDRGALLREYRRDIWRFLAGERDDYPDLPTGYLDTATAADLARFRERATAHRDPALLAQFPAEAERGIAHSWRLPAIQLYANWLSFLGQPQSRETEPAPADRAW